MLTQSKIKPILNSHWKNPVLGIGLSEIIGISRKHAVFLCLKSQFFIMLDWARQLKDWLGSLIPVDQLRSVRHHDWSHVVGFKTLSTEAIIMPKSHNQKPSNKRTLTNSVSPKSIFFLMNSNREIIADNLSYSTAYELSRKNKAIIKFDRMQVAL